MNRLDRLTAILIHLQTKRVVRAQELADRFGISLRTVYRDVRSLEEAGVPIGAEAGVGYFLTDYHLPPVMFSRAEASAFLLSGKLLEKWGDASVQRDFESALYKIKSVLKRTDQEHLTDLDAHINVAKPVRRPAYSDSLMSHLQQAVGQNQVLRIQYHAQYNNAESERDVEPVGLYHSRSWHLIAYCRSRQAYRDFSVDRIRQLASTGERFARRDRLTLQEYLNRAGVELPLISVTIVIEKCVVWFMQEQKYQAGFQEEEDLGDRLRMHFQTPYLNEMARWLLMFTTHVTVENPPELLSLLQQFTADLQIHYAEQAISI